MTAASTIAAAQAPAVAAERADNAHATQALGARIAMVRARIADGRGSRKLTRT